MQDLRGVVVDKPWGAEYLLYTNGQVSCWILQIRQGEATSLHAHPRKLTGVILLDGMVQLNFLNSGHVMQALDKTVLHPHVFHKHTALSDCTLLEVETPPDKLDLVRLGDQYGREGEPYEGPDHWRAAQNLELDDLDAKAFGESLVILRRVARAQFFDWVEMLPRKAAMVIFSGTIATAKAVPVIVPGHIVWRENLRALLEIAQPTQDMEVVVAWRTDRPQSDITT